MSDTILSNSIWPNGMKTDSEGYACFYPLGDNKTPIPTSSSEWPKGNKLVSPFVYQDDKLVGFCDTKAMTTNGNTTTTMPYTYIEADFASIKEGTITVNAPNATFKKISWKNGGMTVIPEAQYKYKGCKTLDDVKAVDSNYQTTDIVNGTWTEFLCDLENGNLDTSPKGSMFNNCTNLITFTSDLSSLTYGRHMFNSCRGLTTFVSNLSSLTNGYHMFNHCDNLTNFTSDLSSLTYSESMFSSCSELTSFTSNLSSLTECKNIFSGCDNLTNFTSDLSSLTSGYYMFRDCKLTPQSVMYIVDSIKDIVAEKKLYQDGIIPYVTRTNGVYSSTKGFMSDGKYVYTYNNPEPYTTVIMTNIIGRLTISINVTDDANTIQDQLQAFAENASFNSWEDLKQAFVDKGWTVTWLYGGTNTAITYDMRSDRAIPCPIYAQLVEVEDKEQAEYTNEEGSKFYNINWGHDVTNYDDFQQFDSLEEAIETFNIKQLERN